MNNYLKILFFFICFYCDLASCPMWEVTLLSIFANFNSLNKAILIKMSIIRRKANSGEWDLTLLAVAIHDLENKQWFARKKVNKRN